ncbi:MAG: tetratricopeptide repeat protein [Balneolales bacterium]
MKIFLLTLLAALFLAPQDGARQANREYEEGNYAEAEEGFLNALEKDPENPRLLFNLGNALARQGKLDEAVQAFEAFKKMESSPSERAKADYNLGNMYSDQEEWDQALQRYRESIRVNPDDEDARFNYELAYRNEEQQQQQQDQQQQNDQDQQDQEGEDERESDPQDGDDRQQGGEQDGDQQQDQSGDNPGNQQNQQQQNQQPEPGSMTAEQADDILKALDNIEKDLLKNYQKNQIEPSGSHEKDW